MICRLNTAHFTLQKTTTEQSNNKSLNISTEFDHKTSLFPLIFIEIPVPSHGGERKLFEEMTATIAEGSQPMVNNILFQEYEIKCRFGI